MTEHDRRAVGGRTIVAVFAHPDDESLACGGTLARAADAGARIVIVSASRGEAGSTSDSALVPDGDLGRARIEELRQAAAILGAAEAIVLDGPDGSLRWAEPPVMIESIRRHLERWQPDAVITFDEDGLYWHPDHVGIHEHTTAAVRAFGDTAPALYYVSLPPGAMRGLLDDVHRQGGEAESADLWGLSADAFGYGAPPPSFAVDVGPWVARKLEALRAHRTQVGARHALGCVRADIAARWLGTERFRRAPRVGRGDRVLEPLAAGACQPCS